MTVTSCNVRGSLGADDPLDSFDCVMTSESEEVKGCEVHMTMTIPRSNPLSEKFQYKKPFLIHIDVP